MGRTRLAAPALDWHACPAAQLDGPDTRLRVVDFAGLRRALWAAATEGAAPGASWDHPQAFATTLVLALHRYRAYGKAALYRAFATSAVFSFEYCFFMGARGRAQTCRWKCG